MRSIGDLARPYFLLVDFYTNHIMRQNVLVMQPFIVMSAAEKHY